MTDVRPEASLTEFRLTAKRRPINGRVLARTGIMA